MTIGPIAALIVVLALAAPSAFADDSPLSHRDDLSDDDRRRVFDLLTAPVGYTEPQAYEAMAGGAATSKASVTRDAFSHASANLPFERLSDFKVGNGVFKKVWVSSPSSTRSSDGLGPLFNARSCQRCHLKDGRGHPPQAAGDVATSLVLRLSVPPRTAAEREALRSRVLLALPEPTYGTQVQDFAVPGLAAEGRVSVSYEETAVDLAGGETASLRRPTYGVRDLGYGPMHPDVMVSARIAPPMIGLGLIEAIHAGDILALADPDDRDGDGISGRASLVRDPETGESVLGRFGWKASLPSVRAQTAAAFSGDIGISNPLKPDAHGDCTRAQQDCRAMPTGEFPDFGPYEANDDLFDLVVFYAANLAVPKRRDVGEPEVLRGKRVFHASGCAACHTPAYVTRRDAARAEHRFQLIWPHTDLLLHDMGDGLADGRPAGDASGREWRTPPLWGIGLTETVSGHTYFLHDGRARSLLEAILWHGGEAQAARDAVAGLDADERAALIRFLESL